MSILLKLELLLVLQWSFSSGPDLITRETQIDQRRWREPLCYSQPSSDFHSAIVPLFLIKRGLKPWRSTPASNIGFFVAFFFYPGNFPAILFTRTWNPQSLVHRNNLILEFHVLVTQHFTDCFFGLLPGNLAHTKGKGVSTMGGPRTPNRTMNFTKVLFAAWSPTFSFLFHSFF